MADIPGRWSHVSKLLERAGPLAHPEFQPNPEVIKATSISANRTDL